MLINGFGAGSFPRDPPGPMNAETDDKIKKREFVNYYFLGITLEALLGNKRILEIQNYNIKCGCEVTTRAQQLKKNLI